MWGAVQATVERRDVEKESRDNRFFGKIISRKEKLEVNGESKNIYRICRENAGLKLNEAAARLGHCERSLKYWESYDPETRDGRLPSESVVIQMTQVYVTPMQKNADYLLVQHWVLNTEIGRLLFPRLNLIELMDSKNLPSAFLRYQAEREDVELLDGKMRKVVIDNQISEKEKDTSNYFLKEMSESIISGWGLMFALMANGCQINNNEITRNERKVKHGEKLFAWR